MELRHGRGAGRGRAPLGGARLALLAAAIYLAAGLAATAPALPHAWSSFLAWGERPAGRVSPGDHHQVAYQLWLPGHLLEQGRAPWTDPYSFRPETDPRPNFAGWPFAAAYWPLARLLGPVRAWNALVLLAFVAAGGLTAAWLRELGMPRVAALAGGLVFALAPYRVAQSTEHLLGFVALLLPLALLGLERGYRGRHAWLALGVAAAVSVPLSGQVHLALGAIPLAALYALWRGLPWVAAAVLGLGAAAGLLVHQTLIATSTQAGGRTLDEVRRYSVDPVELVTRSTDELERVVFLGWLTPVLAAVGVGLLLKLRWYRFTALVLGMAVVPVALALGTNLPGYEWLWEHVAPFRFPRVPGRLLPIGALALAALVAVALAALRRPALAAAAIPLLAFDLWVGVFGASAADLENRAYAVLREQPPGRVLELPAFLPERYLGNVYLHYVPQAPRERPGGYSTLAPPAAERTLGRLRALNCGDDGERLRGLGVRYVVLHRALYAADGLGERCADRARARLAQLGFRPLAHDGGIEALARP